jgi:hypothetical protein
MTKTAAELAIDNHGTRAGGFFAACEWQLHKKACSNDRGLRQMLALSWRRPFFQFMLTFAWAALLFAPLWWALHWVLEWMAE